MPVLYNPKRVSFPGVTLAFHAPPPAPAFNFHYPRRESLSCKRPDRPISIVPPTPMNSIVIFVIVTGLSFTAP